MSTYARIGVTKRARKRQGTLHGALPASSGRDQGLPDGSASGQDTKSAGCIFLQAGRPWSKSSRRTRPWRGSRKSDGRGRIVAHLFYILSRGRARSLIIECATCGPLVAELFRSRQHVSDDRNSFGKSGKAALPHGTRLGKTATLDPELQHALLGARKVFLVSPLDLALLVQRKAGADGA